MSATPLKQLLQKIEDANRRFDLIAPKDSLLVALSGGPDSVALLVLLTRMRLKYGLRLSAAHLDHGLRGVQSRRDAIFCAKLAAKLEIPFYTQSIDVKKLAKQLSKSLEDAGRTARYRYLEDTAFRIGANKIVTAHTLDDQAETVLMRLIRGSGLRGLCGIAARRAQGRVEVIRPLLLIQKQPLLDFLKLGKIPYRVDRSNEKEVFFRNRIRLELLPLLEKKYNRRIREALSDLSNCAGQMTGYFDGVTARAVSKLRRKRPTAESLDIRRLNHYPQAVAAEIVRRVIESKRGELAGIGFSHVEAVLALAGSRLADAQTHLPGLIVRKKNRHLYFTAGRRLN